MCVPDLSPRLRAPRASARDSMARPRNAHPARSFPPDAHRQTRRHRQETVQEPRRGRGDDDGELPERAVRLPRRATHGFLLAQDANLPHTHPEPHVPRLRLLRPARPPLHQGGPEPRDFEGEAGHRLASVGVG